MKVINRLVLHPRGEALVEPQVVPPSHGNEIAEPLVRHLMRNDHSNVLSIPFGGDSRIDQQIALKIKNRPPIFHGTEEFARAWRRNEVELRQRKRHAEIVVVVRQQLHSGIKRESSTLRVAAL